MNCRDAVIKVLQAAASQDVNLMKDAESQLKIWEGNEGFYSTLLDIFLLKNLDVNIRWMSIIYLKNGVTKYWRKSGQNCLSEEEKGFIRNKIITIFDEEVIQLALQLAVIVGKIVRIDIKQWPDDAIQQTLQVVKLDKTIHQHRALLTLNQILKGLASKRLAADQLIFREISTNIFDYLADLNGTYFSYVLQSKNVNELNNSLEMCILITKVLRKLIIFGGKQNEHTSGQIKYLQLCLMHIPLFLSSRDGCSDVTCQEKYEKLLIFLMKILSERQERHSLSFIPILEDTLTLCLERIFASNGSSEFSSFVIYCGNLLRSITRCYHKRNSPSDEESIMMTKTANDIKSKVLTNDCVKRLCQHLIIEYFPLTEADLEEWSGDPEGYMLVEAGESHKFLLRPCMEALFVGLFYEFKNEINPFVLGLTKEVDLLNVEQMSDNDHLKVCSVYTAIGLASYELFHDLDFDMWFERKLVGFLSLPLKTIPLFQQHVIWMVGQWINVKFSKKNRIILYQILSRLLASPEDLVLKLTACKVLRSAIDDFDFDADDFTPYVNNIFVSLCKLLVTVELCDTKMMVLNSLSIMIERINDKVRSEADLLLECLPQLWELSEAHNLLRGAVINVLVHLVKGLGNENMKMLHITLPIIQYSTSVDQPAHVYLLEDGLELWLTVLKNAKHFTEELLLIYKGIPVLFERASETLALCLSITRLYLLIDAKVFLKEYALIISKVFSALLGNIKQEPASKIAKIIKLSLQLVPDDFLAMFQTNLLNILEYILRDEIYPTLMVDYLSIFAYVILHQPAGFGDVIGLYCKSTSCTYEDVMEKLLDTWLDKVDCMAIVDKKITALSLCSMLPHKFKFVFDRFTLILDTCVNVMYDLQKTQGADGETIIDSLVVATSSTSDGEEEIEDTRERIVLSHDPAYTVTLLHYVQGKLSEAKQSYGDQLFAEAMETMDSTVAKQLLSLINV